MSDALNIAINGLNATAARSVKAASSIVNASSTGGSDALTTNLVNLAADKISYAAEAKVVGAVATTDKTLVDILA